jgi:hypothetical protein
MNELEQEVKAVEAEAVKVATEVKTEVVKVIDEVKPEAVKIVGAVKAEAKKWTQEITAEEKLAFREAEAKYLRAQMEINRLLEITKGAQKDFSTNMEAVMKKYVLSPAEWALDQVELIFKKM